MKHLGDWQLVRRIRETRGGVHWQTSNGFLLVELPADIAKTPAKARAFLRDVDAFAAIFHPDIARVVDWTSAGECTYVVLEFPSGATLRELADKTLVPPDVRARIALDALDAVEAAHANAAVFGDLDADTVIISETGQVILLPTCSRARAATPEDDILAVAALAGIQNCPDSARLLESRLRALSAVAQRETVGRFVSRVLLSKAIAPPRATSQAPPRRVTALPPPRMPGVPYMPALPTREPLRRSSADYEELTPVLAIELSPSRAIYELSPDDLIPVGVSEPEIPIYIEEPPDPRDTERPVVSEPEIVVDFRTTPATKRRRVPMMLLAVLFAACAIAVPLFWRDATTWLRSAGVILHSAPRPAPAVEQRAPATQPPAVSVTDSPAVSVTQPSAVSAAQAATEPMPSATAEPAEAAAAPPPKTAAPAKRKAPRRRSANSAAAPSPETEETPQTVESNPYRFVPVEP